MIFLRICFNLWRENFIFDIHLFEKCLILGVWPNFYKYVQFGHYAYFHNNFHNYFVFSRVPIGLSFQHFCSLFEFFDWNVKGDPLNSTGKICSTHDLWYIKKNVRKDLSSFFRKCEKRHYHVFPGGRELIKFCRSGFDSKKQKLSFYHPNQEVSVIQSEWN